MLKYRFSAMDSQGFVYDLWARSPEEALQNLKENDPSADYEVFGPDACPKWLEWAEVQAIKQQFPRTWRAWVPMLDRFVGRVFFDEPGEVEERGETSIEAEV